MKSLVFQVEQSLKKTVDVQDAASAPLPASSEKRMRKMKYCFTCLRKTPLSPSPEKNTRVAKHRGQNAQEIPLSRSPKKGTHQSRLPFSSTAMSELHLQQNRVQHNILVSAPRPSSSHELAGRLNPDPTTISDVNVDYSFGGNKLGSDWSTKVVGGLKKPRRQHSINFSRPLPEISMNAVSTCGSSLSDSGCIDAKRSFDSAHTVPSMRAGLSYGAPNPETISRPHSQPAMKRAIQQQRPSFFVFNQPRELTVSGRVEPQKRQPSHIQLDVSHSQNLTPIISKPRNCNHSSAIPEGLTVLYRKVISQTVIPPPHRRATVTKSILKPIPPRSSRPRPTAIFEYHDFNDGYLELDSEFNIQVEEDLKESAKAVGFSAMKVTVSLDGKKIALEPVVENEGKTSRKQELVQENKKGVRMRKSGSGIVEHSSDDGVPIVWTHPPSEREGGYTRVQNLPSSLLGQSLQFK
jgi:hypothetical protein